MTVDSIMLSPLMIAFLCFCTGFCAGALHAHARLLKELKPLVPPTGTKRMPARKTQRPRIVSLSDEELYKRENDTEHS